MRQNDPLAEFWLGLNYLMFLSREISFLLLGPHISHIVLVVFKAHLRDSSPIKAQCSETFPVPVDLIVSPQITSQTLFYVVF